MSAASVSLIVMLSLVAAGTGVGFLAGRRRVMDLEQWVVGGRRLGAVLVFLLMAGEAFTTFSFLGASGWAYSRGGPTLYILAYLPLAEIVGFFFLPQIWELGKRTGMQTQSDFFAWRYGNRYLAGLVCLVGIGSFIPYIQLQITGLGIIASITSFGGIGRDAAMTLAVGLLVAFVCANGIRAIAWVSVVKDGLMLMAALAIGIGIPLIHFGGVGPMFATLARLHPGHLTMPGGTQDLGHAWYVSTVLLSALGGFMWPHLFGSAFTAKSADALRRNFMVLPLYNLVLVLIFIAGFAALLVVPGLPDGDLALLTVVRQTFPPWFLGLVGGAGALTAMVPAAVFTLTAATLFAKNLVRPLLAPGMSDAAVGRLARAMVIVIGGVSLYLALFSSTTLVGLLLIGYAGVAQFFPGVLFGLYWRRITARSVLAGIVAGIIAASFLMLTGRNPYLGIDAGFLGLCVNFAVVLLLTVLEAALGWRGRASPAVEAELFGAAPDSRRVPR
jgi:SSS family solute:Na+ symporter